MPFVLSIYFALNGLFPAQLHILTPDREACEVLARELAPSLQPTKMTCQPYREA